MKVFALYTLKAPLTPEQRSEHMSQEVPPPSNSISKVTLSSFGFVTWCRDTSVSISSSCD
jgi:hypothetical protein